MNRGQRAHLNWVRTGDMVYRVRRRHWHGASAAWAGIYLGWGGARTPPRHSRGPLRATRMLSGLLR